MTMQRYRPRAIAPWREVEDMESWMDEFFRGWPSSWQRVPAEERAWAPGVEMYEKDDSIIVRAEMPGMSREDIDVLVVGDMLTISGERKASEEIKDEEYYRCEFAYGKFSRSVSLPTAVDTGKVQATYKNGLLEITLPKTEEAKPKKVEVSVK